MLGTYIQCMHNNSLEIRITGDKAHLRGAPTQAIYTYFYLGMAAYQVLLKSLHFIFVGFESVI